VEWGATAERASARYERAGTSVLRGNVAYGAGLAHLMAGRPDAARAWFQRAAAAWRESWAEATPTSWGRPIGIVKALLLAGDEAGASAAAEWALSLGCEDAESPIGRYAATLALLTLGRFEEARPEAKSLRERDDFPRDVADALAFIAAHDLVAYAEAAESVLTSFETRDEYLEAVAVADTLLVLQVLAGRRGIAADLPESPVLPA
jgi:tetratricopeptide (TPR) repeat protein